MWCPQCQEEVPPASVEAHLEAVHVGSVTDMWLCGCGFRASSLGPLLAHCARLGHPAAAVAQAQCRAKAYLDALASLQDPGYVPGAPSEQAHPDSTLSPRAGPPGPRPTSAVPSEASFSASFALGSQMAPPEPKPSVAADPAPDIPLLTNAPSATAPSGSFPPGIAKEEEDEEDEIVNDDDPALFEASHMPLFPGSPLSISFRDVKRPGERRVKPETPDSELRNCRGNPILRDAAGHLYAQHYGRRNWRCVKSRAKGKGARCSATLRVEKDGEGRWRTEPLGSHCHAPDVARAARLRFGQLLREEVAEAGSVKVPPRLLLGKAIQRTQEECRDKAQLSLSRDALLRTIHREQKKLKDQAAAKDTSLRDDTVTPMPSV